MNIFNIDRNEMEINTLSPLVWAYIGDSVYDLYIRSKLVNTMKSKPHKLHIEAIKYVKAKAQAQALSKIMEYLTEEEKEIVRRTRNTRNTSCAQKCRIERLHVCNSF